MASNGCRARDEDREKKQHKHPHQQSNQDQLAPRVAKIQGPPEAEALRDKKSRIVGIVVKMTSLKVAFLILKLLGPFFMATGSIQTNGIQWVPCQR